MNALDDKVPLHPGDQVSFRVIEDRDDAVPRTVTDTGEVDFPYVGRLKVQGMTCRQVAEELKKLLEVDYYKRATVIVGLDVIKDRQTAAHDVAWIVGQVRQIGPQELSPVQPLTVSQMILRAGGFGDFADQRRIRVLHQSAPSSTLPDATAAAQTNKGSDMRVVDVKAVFEGKSKDDPIVLPNDLIVVPKRLVNF
jgi:protein involved in polysaccharide export with SLBB domain